MSVRRILVEKKELFNIEARQLKEKIIKQLGIINIKDVRIINVYDIENDGNDENLDTVKNVILSEPNVDYVSEGDYSQNSDEISFRIQSLPGQYDQRSDSAMQCDEIISLKKAPLIVTSRIYSLKGSLTKEEIAKVKKYLINPIEMQEVTLTTPMTIKTNYGEPNKIKEEENFCSFSDEKLRKFKKKLGLAMTVEDLKHTQKYFSTDEKRNPTETEIRVIDTYWSDHCRHTTFLTEIDDISIEDGTYTEPIKEAFQLYLKSKQGSNKKAITLMDIATSGMKEAIRNGQLNNLDLSDEINACTINVEVDVNGEKVPFSLQFKNETHNHPTEVGPFGGAATCLGGAIRDPLSGRSYVYQAMRVTGSGNPLTPISDTLKGKLPQRVITTEAAKGYSSYGNQVGLATGIVKEYYDPGFVAKRMEVGAVIGAAPKSNIVREQPQKGDIILLIGGRTGRDGIGGATGSSKEHTKNSLENCGTEIQKGNPPEERKIQNIFRIPEVSRMIKKCNDFGAGGVSVAIGELAPSLEIDLDKIPKKYEGLNGTELAISESQERMAVVLDANNVNSFKEYCISQNIECTAVAKVTDTGRLIMTWQGIEILNIKREFLNTNGAKQTTNVKVLAPKSPSKDDEKIDSFKEHLLKTLSDLNVCSQQGLVECFDSTIGANTVLVPFGGKYCKTPIQSMVAKIPLLEGETTTCSIMSHGYDPVIGKWSPFHGAIDSIVDSITKIVVTGGNYMDIRLSLQEYFEKLGNSPEKWGKPFSALLGAYYVQQKLGVYAIGGKDSMSGTFEQLCVPPTVISFAVDTADVKQIISPELKSTSSDLYYFEDAKDERGIPDFDILKKVYDEIHSQIEKKNILAAYSVEKGGPITALSKMSFGNKIGFELFDSIKISQLFETNYGSIVLEVPAGVKLPDCFKKIGKTNTSSNITYNGEIISIDEAVKNWEKTLQLVFPINHDESYVESKQIITQECYDRSSLLPDKNHSKPTVLIPIFPGTNCEIDTKRAFERAGANVRTLVFRNLSPADIKESLDEMVKLIGESQIITIPGGFSAGDEPDGSAKFIVSVFRNPRIADKVMEFLQKKDGLMLGICNGFQALIKLGLLPDGIIQNLGNDSATLTNNYIGRHISSMVATKVVSCKSPWMNSSKPGDIYLTPISHGEGRFYAQEEIIKKLFEKGQVATQYVDLNNNPTNDPRFNLNGSEYAIEGIFSPDGRIFGKMGHIERLTDGTNINIPNSQIPPFISDGVGYYTGKVLKKTLYNNK